MRAGLHLQNKIMLTLAHKWKKSVQDIKGEVLCGTSKASYRKWDRLKTSSIPIHLAGIN